MKYLTKIFISIFVLNVLSVSYTYGLAFNRSNLDTNNIEQTYNKESTSKNIAMDKISERTQNKILNLYNKLQKNNKTLNTHITNIVRIGKKIGYDTEILVSQYHHIYQDIQDLKELKDKTLNGHIDRKQLKSEINTIHKQMSKDISKLKSELQNFREYIKTLKK